MTGKHVTKRCHWVPQSYLRGFAANPERSKIWRFSKIAGDPELKPIDKVAMRHHLYVPRGDDGLRDDAFEKKLANLEQLFGTPFWKALQNDFVDMSETPVRQGISLLVATMFLRHPKQLEFTKQVHAKLVAMASGPNGIPQYIESKGERWEIDPSDWPRYRDATEDDVKRMWIEEMNGATYYAEMFMKMRWSVLFSETPVFITSDTPVTVMHPSLEFKGFMNPETMILFPLSPTRVLSFDHLQHEPANRYYPVSDAGAAQNYLMWRGAVEHMFCHRNPDEVLDTIVNDAGNRGLLPDQPIGE